jgi:dTMP kinase
VRIQEAEMSHKGKLVALEGIDRAGKSSIIERLPSLLSDCKVSLVICGELQSPIAPIIRDLLYKGASPFLKTFLFAADRAWTYESKCLPALRHGGLVIWDRYVDSAMVYRSVELSLFGSDFDSSFVNDINRLFVPPDLTIYIDITAETSMKRVESVGVKGPYNPEFLEKVRAEYLRIAPLRGYVVINGEQSLDVVVSEVAQVIRRQFRELFP